LHSTGRRSSAVTVGTDARAARWLAAFLAFTMFSDCGGALTFSLCGYRRTGRLLCRWIPVAFLLVSAISPVCPLAGVPRLLIFEEKRFTRCLRLVLCSDHRRSSNMARHLRFMVRARRTRWPGRGICAGFAILDVDVVLRLLSSVLLVTCAVLLPLLNGFCVSIPCLL